MLLSRALPAVLLLGAGLAGSARATDEPATAVVVPRIEVDLAVDGVLDEPAWAKAARLTGFHQYEPVDSRPAEEQTEVLVWYAPDAIYFGIRAHDSQPGGRARHHADRDNIAQRRQRHHLPRHLQRPAAGASSSR